MLKLRFGAPAQVWTGGPKDVRIFIHEHKFVESHAP
jgi:hypothetical protein